MRYHCIKCNENDVHVHAGDGYHFGCSGRAIPIATICNPPEPTTIDESDLAPGMVVTTVDDGVVLGETVWVMSRDAVLTDNGIAVASRGFAASTMTTSKVRHIAGRGRPC